MSNIIVPEFQSSRLFFTVALAQRGSDLLLRRVDLLRDAVRATRADRPFTINAWVVMPDHLHAIWTLPPSDCDFATRWRLIKARFAIGLKAASVPGDPSSGGKQGLWQRQIWKKHLGAPEDFDAHMRFCRQDPVLHGLVKDAEHWRWSSFNPAFGTFRPALAG